MRKTLQWLFLIGLGLTSPLISANDPMQEAIRKAKERFQEALFRVNQLEMSYQAIERQIADRVVQVPNVCEGRLSVETGIAVPTANANNSRYVQFLPYMGNKVSLYYNNRWKIHTFTALSLDLNTDVAGSNQIYDVFLQRQGDGTISVNISNPWTNGTNRADALAYQDGVPVLGTDATQRYIGSFHVDTQPTATNHRVDDNFQWRGVYSYCNRIPRPFRVTDASNTWTYNGTAWQQAGADTANNSHILVGIEEEPVIAVVKGTATSSDTTTRNASNGIGIDSNTTNSAWLMGGSAPTTNAISTSLIARYIGYPGIGFHRIVWLESCDGCAGSVNAVFYGDGNSAQKMRSGLLGWVWQ